MSYFNNHLLSALLLSPLLGVLALLVLPGQATRLLKKTAFVFSLIPFFIALLLYSRFEPVGTFQFTETVPWIPSFSIFYRLGLDGVSLLLVLLTTLLVPLVLAASWTDVQKQVREYCILFLILEIGMLGVFLTLDLFLFYIFWELMLIPMYLLIGIWGGQRRLYAAIKFVLYTMVGSLLMLAALITLYFKAGQSFDLTQMRGLHLPLETQQWLFLAFALAFAIKVPLFPLHTWLPDAHTEAPTGASVILAGVLLKMGTYGFFRFALPLFPEATHYFSPLLITLAVIGILYGALVSMVQPDMKKLVAYSSVAHLGFVMLGLLSGTMEGVSGAVLQMINHGISTGALFFLVGMLYERRHSRRISDYGGLASLMPWYTVAFVIVSLSSIGLPGTNGFIGEFLILLGSFRFHPVAACLATGGVIFAAVYLLWMVLRVFYGKNTHAENNLLKDLNGREIALLLPLLALIFWIGFYPKPLLDKIGPSIEQWGLMQTTELLQNGEVRP